MATINMTTTQKVHLHAHPMDSATPTPNPVVGANLSWSFASGPPSGQPGLQADTDKQGAVVTANGAGTWGIRWQAPNGNGDTTTVVVTVDTTIISGGTTTADAPEPK